jgi:hypothetical protein
MNMIDLEPLFDAKIQVARPYEVGATAKGQRRVIGIEGGTFEGPKLRGRILPGGADYQIIRGDGIAELDARYTIETDDGAMIYVTNFGYRHGPADVIARVAAGEEVDPALYYFRSSPLFETAAEKYLWLNGSICVATGARKADAVELSVYQVL